MVVAGPDLYSRNKHGLKLSETSSHSICCIPLKCFYMIILEKKLNKVTCVFRLKHISQLWSRIKHSIIQLSSAFMLRLSFFTCSVAGSWVFPRMNCCPAHRAAFCLIYIFSAQSVPLFNLCGTISSLQHTIVLFLYSDPLKTSAKCHRFLSLLTSLHPHCDHRDVEVEPIWLDKHRTWKKINT